MKFTIEYNFKELPFLDILIKNQNDQIMTSIYSNPQTPNNTSISRVITPKLQKIHSLHPKTTLTIDKNSSCNSKNVVYIIK